MAAAPKVGVHGVYSGSAATVFPTGLGWCGIAWNNEAVRWVTLAQPTWSAAGSEIAAHGEIRERLAPEKRRLVERILAYSDGKCDDFLDIFLDFEDLTDFQREVLRACRQIPWGETRSYGQLAMLAGHPRAARAVGSVMAKNRFPIIVPCHRVVASSAGLGGFSAPGGASTKKKLLDLEALTGGTGGKLREACVARVP